MLKEKFIITSHSDIVATQEITHTHINFINDMAYIILNTFIEI